MTRKMYQSILSKIHSKLKLLSWNVSVTVFFPIGILFLFILLQSNEILDIFTPGKQIIFSHGIKHRDSKDQLYTILKPSFESRKSDYSKSDVNNLTTQIERMNDLKQKKEKETESQKYNFSTLAPKVAGSIPADVAARIKHFLFFVGTSRSGTSFVQRLLNSHPHAVVSDEMGIFQPMSRGKNNQTTKKQIAEQILRFNLLKPLAKHENGLSKGYLVAWKDKITVVGDKKPPMESGWIFQHFQKFLELHKVLQTLFGSVKILSMVRDPYEVVLKTVLADFVQLRGFPVGRDGSVPYDKLLKADNKTGLYIVSETSLLRAARGTSRQINVTVELTRKPNFDIKVYQMEDFIENGRKRIYELCDWLNLECFDNFVDYVMEHKLKASRSRKHLFFWPQIVKDELNTLIRRYPGFYSNGETYII